MNYPMVASPPPPTMPIFSLGFMFMRCQNELPMLICLEAASDRQELRSSSFLIQQRLRRVGITALLTPTDQNGEPG